MFGSNSPLNNLKVASPCPANWDDMIGNDKVRFCGQCNLNVYNISGMSMKDAENLITRCEGRLCVRYYQRRDGTILTDDCPVGLRAIRRRTRRIATATISAVLSFFAGIGIHFAFSKNEPRHVMGDMVQGKMMADPRPTIGDVPAVS